LALLAAWFFAPLPAPEPLLSVDVQRGPEASSLDRSYPFQFATDSPQPTLRMHTDLGQGDVLVELLDAAGVAPVLRLPPLGRRHHDSEWTINVGGGFVAGSQYKLRVAERDVVGNYSLSFAEREGVTLWQRFLALFLVMAMASGGFLAWVRLGPRREVWRGRSLHILWPVLVMSLGIVYAILHEGGHNIGLWLFGALDLGRSDMLGIGGIPHSGRAIGASLTDWHQAVVSIGGPALPILAGYVLLALRVSPVGRRVRARIPALDAFLSMATALFLFSAVALAAQALGILYPDSDFRGFVSHVGVPLWVSRTFLAAAGLGTVGLSVVVGRHVLSVLRTARRALYSRPSDES
jgi:hypothetical protein